VDEVDEVVLVSGVVFAAEDDVVDEAKSSNDVVECGVDRLLKAELRPSGFCC